MTPASASAIQSDKTLTKARASGWVGGAVVRLDQEDSGPDDQHHSNEEEDTCVRPTPF